VAQRLDGRRHGGPVALELRQQQQHAVVAAQGRGVTDLVAFEVGAQVALQRVRHCLQFGAWRVQVLAGQLVQPDRAARQLVGGGDDLACAGSGLRRWRGRLGMGRARQAGQRERGGQGGQGGQAGHGPGRRRAPGGR
jgi:hypothetical protein